MANVNSLPSHAGSLCKDTVQSKKEIKSQEDRIEAVKTDQEKDEHDVRKQQEVLAEYVAGQKDELERLGTALATLKSYVATLEAEQPEATLELVKATEEWTKAGEQMANGKATLIANGVEVEDDEPMAAADEEDDTVY